MYSRLTPGASKRSPAAVTAALMVLVFLPAALCAEVPIFEEAMPRDATSGFARKGGTQPARGSVSVLALFGQFADEGEDGDPVPSFADSLFMSDLPGSFTHYYNQMSFGQLRIVGYVPPGRYSSRFRSSAYVSRQPGVDGQYPRFVQEVLRKADRDVNFADHDNDGPDGIPNSGDDDGYVDYILLITRTTPTGFIRGTATGVGGLGFEEDFVTDDPGADGGAIRIGGDRHQGTILGASSFPAVVGAMAHEFGHALGLPDLYDLSFMDDPGQDPSEDSAGIGAWGLMGRGALGWRHGDGPAPLSAWSRERLAWLGPDNDRVVEVRGDTTGLELADVDLGGRVYRVPLRTLVSRSGIVDEEYLLLEQRQRRGQYYERSLPGEGVMIWHVRPQVSHNKDERHKYVDVVCADGRYGDRGFPLGQQVDGDDGGDNLDFWVRRDPAWNVAHAGNLGDGTDLFDGVNYTRFSRVTNPSTAAGGLPGASSGLDITLTADGDVMRVDIRRPRWSGDVRGQVNWVGDILVGGEIRVAPEGLLRVYLGTRVRFAPSGRLHVEGILEVPSRPLLPKRRDIWPNLRDPVIMEALEPGGTWGGVQVVEAGVARLPEGMVVLRDTLSAGATNDEDNMWSSAAAATAVEDSAASLGLDFALMQNYPNPYDGSTRIPYTLPHDCDLQLDIFNVLGQRVRVLEEGFQFAGRHEPVWQGRDDSGQTLAGGLYLYRLTVPGEFTESRKMLMLGGMASLSAVDDVLRERGSDWSAVGSSLVDGTRNAVFGFAARPTSAQAAYAAGASLTLSQALQRSGASPASRLSAVHRVRESLAILGASADQLRAVDDLLALVRAEPVPPSQESTQAEVARLAQQIVGTRGEIAFTYFQIGVWLQHLRISTVAARSLRLPLSAVADPPANAQTGRSFASFVRELTAPENAVGEAVARALERVADRVVEDARDLRGLTSLVREIETVGELIAGGGGGR